MWQIGFRHGTFLGINFRHFHSVCVELQTREYVSKENMVLRRWGGGGGGVELETDVLFYQHNLTATVKRFEC